MPKPEVNQDKSSYGGARKGAGRKPGAVTTKTRAIAEKAMQDGITPLEVMLKTMRALVSKAEEQDPANPDISMLVEASAVAKDAAPYLHPRLSSVEMNATVSTHEASLDELA